VVLEAAALALVLVVVIQALVITSCLVAAAVVLIATTQGASAVLVVEVPAAAISANRGMLGLAVLVAVVVAKARQEAAQMVALELMSLRSSVGQLFTKPQVVAE
jgi:hypothetical protein